jgi:hypothetical protein
MSWTSLHAPSSRTRIYGASVRVGVAKSGITIVMSGEVEETLGWRAGDLVAIQRGDGSDAGQLRLAPPSHREYKWRLQRPSDCPRGLRVRFKPNLPLGEPDKLAMAEVEYSIKDGGLIVKLPWCVAECRTQASAPPRNAVSKAELKQARSRLVDADFEVQPEGNDTFIDGRRYSPEETVAFVALNLDTAA